MDDRETRMASLRSTACRTEKLFTATIGPKLSEKLSEKPPQRQHNSNKENNSSKQQQVASKTAKRQCNC